MNKPNVAVGWTTTSTLEEAETICRALITTRLAACAQISAPIQSHYVWKGNLTCDTEYRIAIKFPHTHAPAIEKWLLEHHRYEVPQWIWFKMDGASEAYTQWIFQETDSGSQ